VTPETGVPAFAVSTLWRWNRRLEAWEYVTQATAEMKRKVKARHVRHEPVSTVLRWTEDGTKPSRRPFKRTGGTK